MRRPARPIPSAGDDHGDAATVPAESAGEPRSRLIATSRAADGSIQRCHAIGRMGQPRPAIATVPPKGQVAPKGNGTATIVARRGSVEVETTVQVEGMDGPSPVSFRRDVIPAFSQAGCNMGACHGTPTGKGGFRLSLRGYLPDQDFTILSREAGGPADQPARRRDQPDPPQAAGRDAPRGRTAARPRARRPTSSSTTGSRGGRRTTRARPAAVRLEILPGLPRPERPGDDAAGRRPRPLRRRLGPRRHADLLLRLVEPRDRRGRRRRLRPLQDAGRGRHHRPLPRPGRQRPADPPGRGPGLRPVARSRRTT